VQFEFVELAGAQQRLRRAGPGDRRHAVAHGVAGQGGALDDVGDDARGPPAIAGTFGGRAGHQCTSGWCGNASGTTSCDWCTVVTARLFLDHYATSLTADPVETRG
jgi:hypothetical protein